MVDSHKILLYYHVKSVVGMQNRQLMKSNFNLFISDVKNFLFNEINRIYVAVIILGILICYSHYKIENRLKDIENINLTYKNELTNEIKTNRDKIHYRYFNITNSLEDIYKIKINTHNGRINKK